VLKFLDEIRDVSAFLEKEPAFGWREGIAIDVILSGYGVMDG
jgi:hypothetical protein